MRHFTCAELAELVRWGVLKDLPASKRRVNERAKKEGWEGRARAARGGGFEYPFSALSVADQARFQLWEREGREGDAKTEGRNEVTPSAPDSLDVRAAWDRYYAAPDSLKESVAQRLDILDRIDELIAHGATKTRAIKETARVCGQSAATLERWSAMVRGVGRSDRAPFLLPRYTGRTATREIDERLYRSFCAEYLHTSRPCFTVAFERAQRKYDGAPEDVPSLETLKRRLRREYSKQQIHLARYGREEHERKYPAIIRDHSVFHALEAVNGDGHKFDVWVRWEDGKVSRPLGLFWQDIRTGYMLSYRVDRTENWLVVQTSFGDLVERYGIPRLAYLDNGKAFAAKPLTGGLGPRFQFKNHPDDPKGVFRLLGIDIHFTKPYHGQSKPIERGFGDFKNHVSTRREFEGAYTGSNPSEKPSNADMKNAVPVAEFLKILEQEVRAHNLRKGRRSKVCTGGSFHEAFTASMEDPANAVRVASPEQRRLWLLASKPCTPRRQDQLIELWRNEYWDECLVPWAGQRLIARYDPENLKGSIHLYTRDGRYIGEAECRRDYGFNDIRGVREHEARVGKIKRLDRERLSLEREIWAAEAAREFPEIPEPPAPDSKVVTLTTDRTYHPEHKPAAAGAEESAFGRGVAALQRLRPEEDF